MVDAQQNVTDSRLPPKLRGARWGSFAIALLTFFGALPVNVRRFFGATLGLLFALIPTRERQIARLQLSLFMSPSGGAALTSRVYRSLGITAAESLNLSPLLHRGDAVRYQGLDMLAGLVNRGGGVIALTAHTGNWDLLAGDLVHRGIPITTVGKEARLPFFQRLLGDLRGRNGVKTLWRAEETSVRELINELERGRLIAALIDQDTRVASTWVPFFGVAAKTPSALVELALRRQVPMISAFIFRESSGSYRCFLEELPASSIEGVLLEYHRRLEGYLRLYPEQWVWFHKRWRSPNSETTMSTGEYLETLEGGTRRMITPRGADGN